MFMSPCCKFLVRRWWQAAVQKGEQLLNFFWKPQIFLILSISLILNCCCIKKPFSLWQLSSWRFQFSPDTSSKFWRFIGWRNLTFHHIFGKLWCTAKSRKLGFSGVSRFRLLLNDGEYSYSLAMLATQVKLFNDPGSNGYNFFPSSAIIADFIYLFYFLSWTIWCTKRPCPSTPWSKWRSWSASSWLTRCSSPSLSATTGQVGGDCARPGGAAERGAGGKEDWQSN